MDEAKELTVTFENRQTKVRIRRLQTYDEYRACLRLQKSTWGEQFAESVNPMMLMVGQKLGGVTAGAFNEEGELIGFVFGLTGIKDVELVHWSDMLAVKPEWRGKGIGKELKLFQREEVMKLGVKVMNWTYDPLEAVNARLNINHLGVHIAEYVEDMYASGEGSILHSGIGTDRFIVRWLLGEDRVERALRGELEVNPEEAKSIPIVNTEMDNNNISIPVDKTLSDEALVRVEIPVSIQSVKQRSREEAYRWRLNTRRMFEHYLGSGYEVASFYRDPKSNRCFYIMSK